MSGIVSNRIDNCKACGIVAKVGRFTGLCEGCYEVQRKSSKTQWLKDNTGKSKASISKYRSTHTRKAMSEIEKRVKAEKQRLYYQENKEKCYKSVIDWIHRNVDKKRMYSFNRKSLERGAGGRLSADEWKELCNKYDNKCLCCGVGGGLTKDHIVPVTMGGTTDIDNIQPLCKSCNSKKGNKTIDYR